MTPDPATVACWLSHMLLVEGDPEERVHPIRMDDDQSAHLLAMSDQAHALACNIAGVAEGSAEAEALWQRARNDFAGGASSASYQNRNRS